MSCNMKYEFRKEAKPFQPVEFKKEIIKKSSPQL